MKKKKEEKEGERIRIKKIKIPEMRMESRDLGTDIYQDC